MRSRAYELKEHGQSLWLDYIDRSLIENGTLNKFIEEDGLAGITSNPTIFKEAIDNTDAYDVECRHLTREGKNPEEIYDELTRGDVSMAADILRPVQKTTDGTDGYCSIELLPSLAYNARASIAEARRLTNLIGKPNVMVKVPGTAPGLEAIQQLTAEGINVNITLLFSPDQYVRVAHAYIDGMREFIENGGDPQTVFSVASFFLSRIDTKVDKALDQIAKESPERAMELKQLRGTAAISTAKAAYGKFQEIFASDDFRELESQGARIQKVLWASMSAKDPSYSPVKYVELLIGADTIVTVPESTLSAMRSKLRVEDTLKIGVDEAPKALQKVVDAGVDLENVYAELQVEGVEKFAHSYKEALEALGGAQSRFAA